MKNESRLNDSKYRKLIADRRKNELIADCTAKMIALANTCSVNETTSLRVEYLDHADRFIVPSVFDN